MAGVSARSPRFSWMVLTAAAFSLVHCAAADMDGSAPPPGSAELSTAESAWVSEARAEAILARLTLPELAGQMLQGELLNLLADMAEGKNPLTDLNLGSVLSGGSSLPEDNSPRGWTALYDELQSLSLASSSGLPLLYGIDAVHGHNAVPGATIFPHNVGMGATRDPWLAYQAAAVTAGEVGATGLDWTFAPCLAVARDERWGRNYESFGESPALQALLVAPVVLGLQGASMGGTHIVATAKHFIGDGGTRWGTGFPTTLSADPLIQVKQIDQGDAQLDLQTLKRIHGRGYVEAVRAGVGTVMVSFSSVNGVKMSAHRELINGYLKGHPATGGLGFGGFVISDWNAIEQLPVAGVTDPLGQYKEQVVSSINAGIDMLMVEGKIGDQYKYALAHRFIQEGAREGKIATDRLRDAARRILRIKARAGLLDKYDRAGRPRPWVVQLRERLAAEFGSAGHREIARAAVRESLVLLKNHRRTLPLRPGKYDTIYVAGKNANNLGAQCGGWTHGWQGQEGNTLKAEGDRTILEGLQQLAKARHLRVLFAEDGDFSAEPAQPKSRRGVVVAVIGERPYAEFMGDSADLALDDADRATLSNLYQLGLPVVTVLVSARPLIVTDELARWDAFVAAWLPGTQGEGVADVLLGDHGFSGKLPMTWPRNMSQIPINAGDGQHGLFGFGAGLAY